MIYLFLFLIGVDVAHAQVGSGPGVDEMWSTICSTLPFCELGTGAPAYFSQKIVTFVFPLIVAAAVCVIIYAGIKMITGGEEGFTEAKTIIRYALVGIVLSIVTGSIFVFIGNFLLPLLFN